MPELTDENFEKEIQSAIKPVLVDFWMPSCAPCFILSPILEKLANDYREKIILAKVNVGTIPLTAQKYGIEAIPTLLLFNQGKLISKMIGARPESVIKEWLENLLSDKNDKNEQLIKEYKEYAKKNGFKLNPNPKVVEGVIKGLMENEKKYGARYCPCRRITGDSKEDQKIICPCLFMPEEIEREGHCLCGLFVKI